MGLIGLAGRIRERGILRAAIQEAVEGRPCAVLVHGEAGVGKTCLIQAMCEEAAADGVVVLWGRCVRFGAVEAPYVPLIGALQGWVESTEPGELSRVLEVVPAAGDLLPSLGGQTSDNVVRLLAVVDALVMTIASQQPTVLVVDDVHWADLASRDALAYLVAGFRSQRLVVLTTYRDEELGAGHPMHSWLADLRRLPSVTDVQLGRLSRAETEQQLALLLGGRPQGRVVADVMERSDGNPYFSELLVQGVSLTADDLPVGLPTELTEALLAAWHGLSAPAREVMRVLAVAGRPASIDDLRKVSAVSGIKPAALTGALTEATNSGISVAQGADMCWFRHPLLAEVLYATFVPGEAGPVHAAWAKRLRSRSSTGLDEVRRQGDLALHYEAAHDLKACLQASLRAADLARDIRASREEAIHLQRAATLWPLIHHSDAAVTSDEAYLLERVARASQLIGDGEAAFAAWSRALELIDAHADPRRASRLLTEWSSTAARTGRIHRSRTAEHRRAVELVQAFPDSAEYAQALANLADSEWWSGELNAAVTHSDEALLVAERSGSNAALSCAHKVRAFTHPLAERSDRDTLEALQYARMTDDPELVCWAYVGRGNYLQDQGHVPERAQMATEFLQFALDVGALSMAVYAAGLLADELLTLGRLPESNDVIREGLSLAGLPDSSAMVRLSAASLAVRHGNLEIAGMHIQRAKELIVALEENPGLGAPPVLAEYLLATGHPEQALDLLTQTMVAPVRRSPHRRRDVDVGCPCGRRPYGVRARPQR